MIYPITLYGDSVLREACENIVKGETDVLNLSSDMFETMIQADGIGLAAPQIGISKRIFVVDGTSLEDEEMSSFKKVFINPIILEEDGDEWEFEEGCLSIPGVRGGVFRKSEILIRYFDENWNEKEESYDGMKARIIQHEYDHIEGKLFVDYLSSIKRKLIKNKLSEISKGNCEVAYKVKS
ncbi:MAG: peptide deformylase [Flammeovirgaceae bacterium]